MEEAYALVLTLMLMKHIAFFKRMHRKWEELLGMQEILNLPTKQMILNFGHYRFTDLNESGCTVFQGKDYMVRNYDYHPATYDGRYLLYQPNDGGLAQIGPTSRVTGRMDGMNEAGLVMGYNFMHRKHPQMDLYVIW